MRPPGQLDGLRDRPVRPLVAALVTALGAATIVWWPIDPYGPAVQGAARQPSVYQVETIWVIGLLAAAAMAGLFHRRARPAMTTACAGLGLTLGGTGVVAHRRWNTSKGFTTTAGNLDELRALSLALALAGIATFCVCAADVWRSRVDGWRARAHAPIVGLAAMGAVPVAMGWETGRATTQIGAHVLMYGVPWGSTILLGSWGAPSVRIASLVTPCVAGSVLVVSRPMIPASRPAMGFAATIVLAALLAAGTVVRAGLVRRTA